MLTVILSILVVLVLLYVTVIAIKLGINLKTLEENFNYQLEISKRLTKEINELKAKYEKELMELQEKIKKEKERKGKV